MSIYIVDEVIKTPGSSLSPGDHVHSITAVAAVTPKACSRFSIYTAQTHHTARLLGTPQILSDVEV
jgi:hypothetical protein